MDINNAGWGAGGGIMGAILTWLGVRDRMDSHEKRIVSLEEGTVYKDQHHECSRAWHEALERVEKKLDLILEKVVR